MTAVEETTVEVMGTGAALEALNRSEVDMQIATAKKYPRSISRVREKVLEVATCDQEVAASCHYNLPRDGKNITGPSVRLAEIVASSYQNLRCGARVIGEERSCIVCQGVCIDMENNVSASVEVRRRITTKNGSRYGDDMINTTANAGCAIAFRNAIFKVVPSAIFKDIQVKIRNVARGDESTLPNRRNAAIAFFKGKGIKEAQIIGLLDSLREEGEPEVRKVEDITLDHLQILIGIKNAVADGDTTFAEAFAMVGNEFASKTQTVMDKLKARKDGKASATAEPKDEASAPSDHSGDANEMVSDQTPPPDGCKDFQELCKLNERSPAIMAKAIELARGKYDDCATLRAFCDLDCADISQCKHLLESFRAAQGK